MRPMPFLLAVLLMLGWPVAGQTAAPAVTIGVLAYLGAERGLSEWEPTRAVLEQALPDAAVQLVPLDIDGMRRAVAGAEVDFVITNPGNYVELEARYGISRIAMLDAGGGMGGGVASAVIVRADRPELSRMADLRGRSVAAVAADAFGGFQVAWREFQRQGLDPFADLADLRFVGFPMDRILAQVAAGEVDAGIVRACLLERMIGEGRVPAGLFKVLDERPVPGLRCRLSSDLYPDWPIAKLPGTAQALAKQVAIALLAMDPTADQPGWTVPLDYQAVHALFRDLRIGPFAGHPPTLAELFERYWEWLAAALAVLLWWVAHVWRVEHLVKQRTRELTLAQERERRQREEMEHVARLSILGEMAGNLAHELNQPLAAIANYADGCAFRLNAGAVDRDDLIEATGRIADQARRAGRVIQRIRAFIRKRPPAIAPFDLNEAVREACELFEPQARRSGITVDAALADGLPAVEGDRIQVQQVLLNLLQNAADAMAATPAEARRIAVRTAAEPGGIVLSVADAGGGFASEALQRLFEPYFTTKPDGIGLGLALSRSIIEAHGGRLSVANLSRGAVVSVNLPQGNTA
jgi:two-component system sensor histidine kinase TtrS